MFVDLQFFNFMKWIFIFYISKLYTVNFEGGTRCGKYISWHIFCIVLISSHLMYLLFRGWSVRIQHLWHGSQEFLSINHTLSQGRIPSISKEFALIISREEEQVSLSYPGDIWILWTFVVYISWLAIPPINLIYYLQFYIDHKMHLSSAKTEKANGETYHGGKS